MKNSAKFLATTNGYFMAKTASLNDAFSDVFEPEAKPVEGQSLQQLKDKKRRKRKAKKNQKA